MIMNDAILNKHTATLDKAGNISCSTLQYEINPKTQKNS